MIVRCVQNRIMDLPRFLPAEMRRKPTVAFSLAAGVALRQKLTSGISLKADIKQRRLPAKLAVIAGTSPSAAGRKALQHRGEIMAFALRLVEHQPTFEIVEMLAHERDRAGLVAT